jgi:1,4-dihydroxy-2-naphthoate octaprenyltransferase
VLLGQLPLLALVSLLALPLLVSPLRISARRELEGRALVPLLPLTARMHAALGVLLAAALLVVAVASGSPLAHSLW